MNITESWYKYNFSVTNSFCVYAVLMLEFYGQVLPPQEDKGS